MAWDKNLPDGSVNIALGDDAIRLNNAGLENAFDDEHSFVTGGNQSGRHAFKSYSSQVGIDTLVDGVATGSVAFRTDPRTNPVWYVWNGAAWVPVDVEAPTIPRIDEQSKFTAAQQALIEELTVGTGEVVLGTPDDVTIDLARSAYRYYSMVGATEFAGFTNDIASHGTTISVEITQPGTAAAITFAAGIFEAAYGAAPVVGTGDSEKTLIQFIKQQNAKWAVVTAPALGAI